MQLMRDSAIKHLKTPPLIAPYVGDFKRTKNGEPTYGVVRHVVTMPGTVPPPWDGIEIPAGLIHAPAEDQEATLERKQIWRAVELELDKLTDRNRAVLVARFGLEGEYATLVEAGQLIGVTRERVRQIEARTLRKIRRSMERCGLSPFIARAPTKKNEQKPTAPRYRIEYEEMERRPRYDIWEKLKIMARFEGNDDAYIPIPWQYRLQAKCISDNGENGKPAFAGIIDTNATPRSEIHQQLIRRVNRVLMDFCPIARNGKLAHGNTRP